MSATLLQFPQRDKGRIRKRSGLQSTGRLVLGAMQHHGEEIPANVVCIDQPNGPEHGMVERSDQVLLAICVYAVLSDEQKDSILRQLKFLAVNGDPSAQRVWNTITAAPPR